MFRFVRAPAVAGTLVEKPWHRVAGSNVMEISGSGPGRPSPTSRRKEFSDISALVAVRALVDVLATMVKHDRIGGKLA